MDRTAERVLGGALRVWGVPGTVCRDGVAFLLCTAAGSEVRVVPAAPRGWKVFQHDRLLGEAAGLPGLLRQLREALAPEAARGRLIVAGPLP